MISIQHSEPLPRPSMIHAAADERRRGRFAVTGRGRNPSTSDCPAAGTGGRVRSWDRLGRGLFGGSGLGPRRAPQARGGHRAVGAVLASYVCWVLGCCLGLNGGVVQVAVVRGYGGAGLRCGLWFRCGLGLDGLGLDVAQSRRPVVISAVFGGALAAVGCR